MKPVQWKHFKQQVIMIKIVFLCWFLKVINGTEDCGVIVLGQEFANSGNDRDVKAPWIAAIGKLRNTSDGYKKFDVYCSGTILTRKFIITAAHCEFKKPQYVRTGVTRIDQAYPQDRMIEDIKIHPDHNKNDWYYDIALVKLKEDLIFNGKVSALCLPDEPSNYPVDGIAMVVQGWGEDINGDAGKEVTEARISVRSKQECDHKLSTAGPDFFYSVRKFLPRFTSTSTICADSTLYGQVGTCRGDSGGPAFIRLDKFVFT